MFWLWKKNMWNVTKCFYSKEIFQIFFEMLKSSYGKSAGKNFGENIVIYQLCLHEKNFPGPPTSCRY